MKHEENENEVDALNEIISNNEAETNRNIILKHFQSFSENPENVSLGQVWKTMNKLWPKCGESLPAAKKDHKGKIVSAPKALKKLLAKEYKERLRTRKIRPDLKHLEEKKKRIFLMKLKLAESNRSALWTLSELDIALKDLKTNRS